MTIADALIRDKALNPKQSFIVSAPAGSGKTELLIQRYLTLLAGCEKPEQVIMITFTRKAAAEVKERIFKALKNAKQNLPIQSEHEQNTRDRALAVLEQDKRQQWQLILTPYRLQIRTIDSFCYHLVQQMSLANGGNSVTAVIDDATDIYREAVVELFKYLSNQSQESELYQHYFELLKTYDNNLESIAAMLSSMLQNRFSWLSLLFKGQMNEQTILDNFKQYASLIIAQLRQELGAAIYELEELVVYASQNYPEFNGENILPSKLDENTTIKQWQNVIQILLLTKEGKWRKNINKNNGFPQKNKQKQQMLALLQELSIRTRLLPQLLQVGFLPDIIAHTRWHHLHALTQLLPHLVAILNNLFEARGCCDHSAITTSALSALEREQSPTDLALRLDYQIQHILVDEFQDTSDQQIKLLELLTEGWQPGDGKTLFLVGDAMQSIYSFRQANVGLFINAKEKGVGQVELESLSIRANFRSHSGIVDWVNETFSQVLPNQDDCAMNQTGYNASTAVKGEIDCEAVNYHLFEQKADEAKWIVDAIKNIQNQEKNQAANIAILVRNRRHLRDIIELLNKYGIQWVGNDLQAIKQDLAVIDLLSLTKCFISSADRISWFGILRSPLVGLTSRDLLQLHQSNPHLQSIWHVILTLPEQNLLTEEGYQRIQRFKNIMSGYSEKLGTVALRELVEACWRSLGGDRIITRQALYNCESYLQLLEQHQEGGLLSDLQNLETALATTYSSPQVLETKGSVQIMTIHKSKGLEFDYVFIPAMERIPKSDDNPLIRWRERTQASGEPLFLIAPKPATAREDTFYDCLKEDAKQLRFQELQRLLYVGCTRAVKQLFLTAVLKQDKEFVTPPASSLLEIIWPIHSNQFFMNSYKAEKVDDWGPDKKQGIWRLPIETGVDYRQEWLSDSEEKNQPKTIDQKTWQLLGSDIGTLLHRTLKQIVIEGVDCWNEGRIARQLGLWYSVLQSRGFSQQLIESALDRIKLGIDNALNDNTGLWILNNNYTFNEVEYSIDYIDDNGTPKTKIIDRCFIDGDICWIIDYKSQSRLSRKQKEVYSIQLGKYEDLLKQMVLAKQFKKALYLPLSDGDTFILLS